MRQAHLIADFPKEDTTVDAVEKDASVKMKCKVGKKAYGARELHPLVSLHVGCGHLSRVDIFAFTLWNLSTVFRPVESVPGLTEFPLR